MIICDRDYSNQIHSTIYVYQSQQKWFFKGIEEFGLVQSMVTWRWSLENDPLMYLKQCLDEARCDLTIRPWFVSGWSCWKKIALRSMIRKKLSVSFILLWRLWWIVWQILFRMNGPQKSWSKIFAIRCNGSSMESKRTTKRTMKKNEWFSRQEDGANALARRRSSLQKKEVPDNWNSCRTPLWGMIIFIYTFRNDRQDQANQKKGDWRNDI